MMDEPRCLPIFSVVRLDAAGLFAPGQLSLTEVFIVLVDDLEEK
jgi:hypothetical protein